MWIAVEEGRHDVVRKLLLEGADPSDRRGLLSAAADYGHVDVMKVLLEYNADPNQRVADGLSPVCIAAHGGRAECLEVLLAHNVDPNQEAAIGAGIGPVWAAADGGHAGCVTMLLEHNADPNQAMAENGATPVYVAAMQGHVGVVRALLEHNADPNQAMVDDETDDETTPLHVAAYMGNDLAARFLVVYGASLTAVTTSNLTPAGIATDEGHRQLANWLNAVATWSPLRIAAALRMHATISFLLQQGRLDPDDRAKFPAAEIMAVISSVPTASPWGNALPPCRTTIKLVRDASFGWKYSRHRLYHASVKEAVFAVLAVEGRLEQGRGMIGSSAALEGGALRALHGGAPSHAPLPLLPPEIWLFIMQFFQRSWW